MIAWDRVGERLREAVAARQISLAALAESAQLPREHVEALNSGRPAPVTTAALARLARQLDLPPLALWSESPETTVELSLRFRHASVPDFFHADEKFARRAVRAARTLLEVDGLLGREQLRSHFGFRGVGQPPYEDGYRLAREVRRVLFAQELLPNEAAPLPDPMDDFIEDVFGIPIFDEPLQSAHVLAFTARDVESTATAIVFNQHAHHYDRRVSRRVTVGHELAHALFDGSEQSTLAIWIDSENDTEQPISKDGDPKEQRARAFAAELLVPRLGLRELLGPPPATHASLTLSKDLVGRACEHFGSSVRLTAHHLANNRYVPEYLHDELVSALRDSPSKTQRRDNALIRRVRDAVESGVMSEMAALEALGLSVWDSFVVTHK